MPSNLLHEALETDFTYTTSKYFIGYDMKKFVLHHVIPIDPFVTADPKDYKTTQFTLLTPEQERSMFVHYNHLKMICQGLVAKYNQTRNRSTARVLEKHFITVKKIKESLSHAFALMAVKFAHKAYGTAGYDTDFADFLSEAGLALTRCIERFNVDYGWKFNTFLGKSLVNCFPKRYGRGSSKLSIDAENCPKFEGESAERSDSNAERLEEFRNLASALDDPQNLEPRELEIIKMRYLYESPLTLNKVAEHFGISRERVRQIEAVVLAKLKIRMMVLA